MEKNTQNAFWRRAEKVQAVCTECSKDFILPDSYPDIRKILYTSGTLCPERSYIDGGRFTGSGTLVCKVLFSDENDELHTVSFTLDYSAYTSVDECEGEAMVSAEESLQSVSARALNPRKLGIKGKIELTPRIYYVNDAGPQFSPDIPEGSIEKRTKIMPFWKLMRVSERSLEASEDLTLSGDAPLTEVIYSNLKMEEPACEAMQGSIRFTGEGALELLYRTSDGALRYAELPIPFHSSIDAEVTPDALCTVALIPEALSCIPAEDATGEAHGVELDFTYTVSAWIAMPAECAQVTDCYSTETMTATEEGSASQVSALRRLAKGQRRMLASPSEGLKKCMKPFARVWVDSRERVEGKLCLHCVAEVTLLGFDESGAVKTLTLNEAFPWEIEEADEASIRIGAIADAVIEGEEVKVTLTLNADGLVWQNGEISYVTALKSVADGTVKERAAVTLCYPLPGEGIWEIAKRYRLPQSTLLAANTVTEGELPKVLLVPSARKAIFSKMI